MDTEKKVCPCCGMDYIREEYDICLTCGWEYDPVQNDRPDFKGGANSDSLNEHRDWYKRMYAKDKRFKWCDTWENRTTSDCFLEKYCFNTQCVLA